MGEELNREMKIGVLVGENFTNKTKMKDTLFNLVKKYGEDKIEIVTSVVKYGISNEVKKFVLEGGCGDVGFCEFPPHHHLPTTHTKNPPYQYGKPYHPLNYRDCYFEVCEYSDGIVFFLTPTDKFWIDEVMGKCKELEKSVMLVEFG